MNKLLPTQVKLQLRAVPTHPSSIPSLSPFFLFQFLQLCSSQSSLRGHLKWAINFFISWGSQRRSSQAGRMAAQARRGSSLAARRAGVAPLRPSALGRVMKDKLLPMACSHQSLSPVRRPSSRGAYQRDNFSKPRLLHLLIHRNVLNSLTWYV